MYYKDYAWKVGSYCDKSLHLFQDSTSTLRPDIDPIDYSKIVIKFYFQAIDKGHNEAMDNFPRLLELLELYPEIGPTFKTHVSMVCFLSLFFTNYVNISLFNLRSHGNLYDGYLN